MRLRQAPGLETWPRRTKGAKDRLEGGAGRLDHARACPWDGSAVARGLGPGMQGDRTAVEA